MERDVETAGDRDLRAEQALRRAGVVGEHVADVARLPPRVADRVPGVAHLELRELLEVVVDERGEAPQQASPVTRGDVPPRLERPAGAGDGGVGLSTPARSRAEVTTSSVAGLMTCRTVTASLSSTISGQNGS